MSSAIKNMLESYDNWVAKFQAGFVPLLLLFCRLWVAWVFFNSGLTKIASWDSTLFLLEYYCQVPIVPWQLAA